VKRFFVLPLVLWLALSAWARADGFTPAPSFSRPHPSVVRVVVPERDGASLGSGALVAVNESSGLVLTNWHVVRDAAGPIAVYFPDGFRSGAYLLRVDRDWDLAALAIWRPNAAPIPLSGRAPRPGESLTIAGYGSGSYRALTGRCTQYVSPGGDHPFEMIELSAPARNGDSGGPILNDRGELAGILFGSSFGRTSGSYCGRLRWFMDLASGDFQRVSAQALLARQTSQNPPALAAVSEKPIQQAPNDDRTQRDRTPPLRAATSSGDVSRWPSEREGPAMALDRAPAPSPTHSSLTAAIPAQPTVAVSAAPPAGSSAWGDQLQTILAAIGALALLYHSIRLLGAAIG